ncbi:DUF883 family protein [Imbroritus primus]|uniref:DUF883 family protein n=1 Tax=Imbroritus primus TaxID=3058603 RepID=UPI003D161C3E
MTLLKNTRVREEMDQVSQTAQDAVRHARGAARNSTSAIREAAQPVREDIQQLLRDVEHAAGTLKQETSAEARALRDSLQARAHDLREAASDKAKQARAKAAWCADETARQVRASPLKAIGIAAGVGALLGLIFAGSRQTKAGTHHDE